MLTTHEILVQAKTKIANRSNWTQGMRARDAKGIYVRPTSERAVCWCAEGAVIAITGNDEKNETFMAFHKLDEAARLINFISEGTEFLFAYALNDFSTHETVMKMFDLAIEKSKSR